MAKNEAYIKDIESWRVEKDADLRRENSWLALAGLFWLRPGTNTVGSDPSCDIRLPDRAPRHLGRFEFEGNIVRLIVEPGHEVELNGMKTRETVLDSDQEETPGFIRLDGMCMVVVQRAKGTGLRLWDNMRPQRTTFPPRSWFPVKSEYRIAATYTRYSEPKTVQMPDIFGDTVDDRMDGEVAFELAGSTYKLLVTELPDRRLYIQFSDKSNGLNTYPSGRYLYIEPPEGRQVFIDFNKAYSPPCAFTGFATCSFSPPENRLNIAIEAGEIYKAHS